MADQWNGPVTGHDESQPDEAQIVAFLLGVSSLGDWCPGDGRIDVRGKVRLVEHESTDVQAVEIDHARTNLGIELLGDARQRAAVLSRLGVASRTQVTLRLNARSEKHHYNASVDVAAIGDAEINVCDDREDWTSIWREDGLFAFGTAGSDGAFKTRGVLQVGDDIEGAVTVASI